MTPRTGVEDAVVVGSGVAGVATALALARSGAKVTLVTKGPLEASTTRHAQGGIAAALAGTGDDPADHLADTLRAGAGLCDPAATRVLAEGAPSAVSALLELGTRLDHDEAGQLARSREGGHGVARVVHAGGAATGEELVRALTGALAGSTVAVRSGFLATRLVVASGRCTGIEGIGTGGEIEQLPASGGVVLATGGVGQLFALTTNPSEATGDGVALALRAGVPVADLEFVQFHPTALAVDLLPRPLLSEALRGEGAVLVGRAGRRFVDELAPRDVVARAIARQMAEDGADHVYLDARGIEAFARRFPSIAAALAAAGLDPARDLLPVAPAAHYSCGGVLTDLDGASAVAGCYAVGEVACTGVHGANRLASNSLLEGLVFAPRVAAAIARGADGPSATGALAPLVGDGDHEALAVRPVAVAAERRGVAPVTAADRAEPASVREVEAIRRELGRAMSQDAGVERDGRSLARLAARLDELSGRAASLGPAGRAGVELGNLLVVGSATVALATERQESRGAHFRRDHPDTLAAWRCRLATVASEGTRTRSGATATRERHER